MTPTIHGQRVPRDDETLQHAVQLEAWEDEGGKIEAAEDVGAIPSEGQSAAEVHQVSPQHSEGALAPSGSK